jgi:hypothetical protein
LRGGDRGSRDILTGGLDLGAGSRVTSGKQRGDSG